MERERWTGWLHVGQGRFIVTKVKQDGGKIWHWLATDSGEPSITIAGLDLQADGGAHVHNTREIGR